MKPRKGVQLADAVTRLRQLVLEGNNARSSYSGVDELRDAYLMWVHDAERVLRALFEEPNIDRLHTSRYWRIQSAPLSVADRPFELIDDEIEVQTGRFETLATGLEEEVPRAQPGSTIAVPDTHVLLHYRLFDDVPWKEVVDASAVRLVVPLRVVDELDEKKSARRSDLAGRARAVLAHLEQHVGSAWDEPARLPDGVTVEVFARLS